MVTVLSNVPGEVDFTEAVSVANAVASVSAAGLAAILCRFGFRLVAASSG
jgi:hypothetical protein